MKFIDDKNKQAKWYNRNYFWVATIIYIAINIIFFTAFPYKTFESTRDGFYYFWDSFWFYLKDAYIHSSWSHVLHNMLCFAIPAFYLERKNGSFSFGLLILLISVICSISGHGQSFIWAFMMGYMLIDYLFSFKKERRNKTNTIIGAIVLALIYFRCCFYDTASGGISITWYPYQLIENGIHAEGYLLGLVVGVVIQISQLFIILQSNKKEITKTKTTKIEKVLYLIAAVVILGSIGSTIGTSVATLNRNSYTVNFICDNTDYNKSYEAKTDLYEVISQWEDEFNLSDSSKYYIVYKEECDDTTIRYFNNLSDLRFIPLTVSRTLNIYVTITPYEPDWQYTQ